MVCGRLVAMQSSILVNRCATFIDYPFGSAHLLVLDSSLMTRFESPLVAGYKNYKAVGFYLIQDIQEWRPPNSALQ